MNSASTPGQIRTPTGPGRWRYLGTLLAVAAMPAVLITLSVHAPRTAVSPPQAPPAPPSEPAPAYTSRVLSPAEPAAAPAGTAAAGGVGLSLYGTFARSDPSAGYAVIGADPRSAELYGAGAEVLPGLLLQEIYADRVVLERNGVRLALSLAGPGGGPVGDLPAPVAAVDAPSPAVHDLLRASPSVDSERTEEGAVRGVRIFPGRNRGAFAASGLHPGDLLTAVDGQPVGADPASLQRLLYGGAAVVTVFRAGRLQQLTVPAAENPEPVDTDSPSASP